MSCPGSLALEAGIPDQPSVHSDSGTACHIIAAEILREDPDSSINAFDWVMERVRVSDEGEPARFVEITEDLATMTQGYVDAIRERSAGCELHVEKRLNFTEYVDIPGMEEQFGTIDAHWLQEIHDDHDDGTRDTVFEIDICDLKTGFKWVDTDSPQLLIYALCVLALYELSHDIVQVRLMIFQPRHGGMREQVMPIAELLDFAKLLQPAAALVQAATDDYGPMYLRGEGGTWWRTYLNPNPNEIECAFCRAAATCPSAREQLEKIVGEDFEVIADDIASVELTAVSAATVAGVQLADSAMLGKMMSVTGFLEDWIKAVRAETERRLLLSDSVDGYGLELGRQGARAWKDPEEAERMVREQFRIKGDLAYTKKLKSPTQLEKLAEVKKPSKKNPNPEPPVITPIQWEKLQPLVVRSDAVPSVKPVTQIKIPYSPTLPSADEFDTIDEFAEKLRDETTGITSLMLGKPDDEVELW